MKTLIIDYGMSNMASITQAIRECGSNVCVSDNPLELKNVDNIILPGVGAFPEGMKNLKKYGWIEPLKQAVKNDGKALLGICLGMQLLATIGYEGEETEGLNLIPGEIRLLNPSNSYRIPHVGWNDILLNQDDPLFNGIKSGTDFYFVHSYHFCAQDVNDVIAKVEYGCEITAAVGRENVFGTQFHPEKSGKAGFGILKNFLSFSRGDFVC